MSGVMKDPKQEILDALANVENWMSAARMAEKQSWLEGVALIGSQAFLVFNTNACRAMTEENLYRSWWIENGGQGTREEIKRKFPHASIKTIGGPNTFKKEVWRAIYRTMGHLKPEPHLPERCNGTGRVGVESLQNQKENQKTPDRENGMKTLEEVIRDAIRPHYITAGDQTKAIADAVRGWMRAQVILDYNERLIAELERQLEDERWMHAACLTIVEGASGIKSIEEITMPVSEAMRQCFRVRTELDAAKARIAELEAEVERLKSKAVQLLDYINELHSAAPGVTHTASAKEVWEMVLGKANKYDALRKKFPFLPGEYFYALSNNAIRKFQCCEVFEDDTIKGTSQHGSAFVGGVSECYATLQELISKLEVIE